jgi:hypothetical protein
MWAVTRIDNDDTIELQVAKCDSHRGRQRRGIAALAGAP